MKVDLYYVGKHQEKNVVEVDEGLAKELLKTGNYEPVNKSPNRSKVPSMDWTEKQIKTWIKDNDIPITYNISNDEKVDKLKEIEEYYGNNSS